MRCFAVSSPPGHAALMSIVLAATCTSAFVGRVGSSKPCLNTRLDLVALSHGHGTATDEEPRSPPFFSRARKAILGPKQAAGGAGPGNDWKGDETMGKLAVAAKITHVPSMYLSELDGPGQGKRQSAIDGHLEIGRRCREAGVDTIVVFDTHWLVNAAYHINCAPHFAGLYTSNELPHFIAN